MHSTHKRTPTPSVRPSSSPKCSMSKRLLAFRDAPEARLPTPSQTGSHAAGRPNTTKSWENNMRRRIFVRTCAAGILAGGSLRSLNLATNEARPVPMPAVAEDSPFPLSVMLWTVYRDLPFAQRLEKVAEAGYHAVELVDEFT